MGSSAVRDEAEKLVSEVFAAAARAARDVPGDPGCRCPVCRTVEAVRAPDPAVASRVAGAVGDVASGVAGLLRSLSDLATDTPRHTADDEPDGTGPSAEHDGPAGTGGAEQKGDGGCH
ncbi:hypothetical protein [Actinocatenispora rupis]|uniref:Uncharacterized protein n=1 Tax=Actinocatenispora rupis TaxID=519421 RepID=A0A8J3J7M0_9ACTN|nr:hypothetical protein [Actinocatenispora rupis]GID13495.1 hypothetical protein Aru02nite_43840 [Actinocatenispora rupis]